MYPSLTPPPTSPRPLNSRKGLLWTLRNRCRAWSGRACLKPIKQSWCKAAHSVAISSSNGYQIVSSVHGECCQRSLRWFVRIWLSIFRYPFQVDAISFKFLAVLCKVALFTKPFSRLRRDLQKGGAEGCGRGGGVGGGGGDWMIVPVVSF